MWLLLYDGTMEGRDFWWFTLKEEERKRKKQKQSLEREKEREKEEENEKEERKRRRGPRVGRKRWVFAVFSPASFLIGSPLSLVC